MLNPSEVFATVEHYSQALNVLRQRIDELELAFESVESVAGITTGYLSKIVGSRPIKRMSVDTFLLLAQALGLKVTLADDPVALARFTDRCPKRRKAKRMPIASTVIQVPREHFRLIGRRGGLASRRRFSDQQKRELAQRAAQARWRREQPTLNGNGAHSPAH